ncbi:MAG: YkgJ family cysteine cluster protein [Deltaproteobacteria bacterium]|jgi:Fe-S-cluster containining protein|nr:YkgJ family cysteine cluster protein [Deltaproteobacteria bacterium]
MNKTEKNGNPNKIATAPVFKCQMCGHCCHGESTVSMTETEQKAISAALGIPVAELLQKYCVVLKNRVEMKTIDGHCIFYGEDGRCQIHEVKPFPCRQWPLHPSILGDSAAWEAISRDCPGFRKDITYDDVCDWLKGALKKEGFSGGTTR